MPTRRIDDLPAAGTPITTSRRCSTLRPGIYEHECPGCGRKYVFRVDGPRLRVPSAQGSPWSLPHPRSCLRASH